MCPPGVVADVGEQVERAPQVVVGLVVPSEPGAGETEAAVRVALTRPVPDAGRGGERDALRAEPVLPVPLPVQETGNGPGESPGVALEPGPRRERYGGEQDGDLGGEPRRGGRPAPGSLRRHARPWRREADLAEVRVQREVGGVCGVQAVVEQPVNGGTTLGRRLSVVGEAGSVRAQQVVERVTPVRVLGEEVRPGQLAEQGPDRLWGVPARLATAGAETSGPGCRLSSRNSRTAGGLSVRHDQEKTARTSVASSPPRKASRSPSSPATAANEKWRLVGGSGRDDGQCEGQPRAALGDVVGRRGLGGDLVRPEPADQHVAGFVGAQQIEDHRLGALGDDERDELVAAGDDREAVG